MFPFFVTSFTRTALKLLPFYFSVLSFRSTLTMASCVFSNGRENINLSLVVGFVEIFDDEKFAAKFEMSSLDMRKFLSRIVRVEKASSRKIVKLLEVMIGRRRKGSSTSVFAIMDPPLLREACMEQIHQTPEAFSASHTYAAVDVQECSFRQSGQKKLPPPFFNASTFLQSISTKK